MVLTATSLRLGTWIPCQTVPPAPLPNTVNGTRQSCKLRVLCPSVGESRGEIGEESSLCMCMWVCGWVFSWSWRWEWGSLPPPPPALPRPPLLLPVLLLVVVVGGPRTKEGERAPSHPKTGEAEEGPEEEEEDMVMEEGGTPFVPPPPLEELCVCECVCACGWP